VGANEAAGTTGKAGELAAGLAGLGRWNGPVGTATGKLAELAAAEDVAFTPTGGSG